MKPLSLRAQGQLVADFLAGSWRTQQDPVVVSPAELDLLTSLLYNSGSAGLAWWRIHESELRNSASGELLHQGYRLQALQSAIQEERIGIALGLMRAGGIEPILIKGWAAARSYPHRTVRAYGDIDLVVKPGDYPIARAILDRSEISTWWVDLHKDLVELDDRSVDELFKRSRTENLKDLEISILSDEDHLVLLAMHFFKHSAWRPSGLCDVAAVVESLSADFDWKLCLGSSKRRTAWIASAIVLAHQLLGARIDSAPLIVRSHNLPAWLLDTVLKQWGRLFTAEHSLPGQPRPLLGYSLRNPRTLVREIRERWPDPIIATFNLRGQPNAWPRLPYQFGAFVARAGQYFIGHRRAT